MRQILIALACSVVTCSCVAVAARDGLVDNINAARASGCGGKHGAAEPLQPNRQLDAAAQRLAGGEQLADALRGAGYRAIHSTSLHVKNPKSDQDIARTLARRSCAALRSETLTDVGIERRGSDVWVVLAEPFDAKALANSAQVAQQILTLANQARSRARRCGSKRFAAVPPLTLDSRLTAAAHDHARDLAQHNRLAHEGSDGSTPAVRATRKGYAWRTVGENIASGPMTPEEVMEGWLASPGHCENLMSPGFTQMGISYVVDPKSVSGVYWAQLFAAPR